MCDYDKWKTELNPQDGDAISINCIGCKEPEPCKYKKPEGWWNDAQIASLRIPRMADCSECENEGKICSVIAEYSGCTELTKNGKAACMRCQYYQPCPQCQDTK